MAGTIPAPRRRGHGAGRRRLGENRTPGERPWAENGDVPSVLIGDDHAGFRARARRMLEAEGWQVAGEADDGASALVAARDLAPEVVLLDVHLPDASGLAVAGDLTAAPSAPAVVLTSSRDACEFEEAIPG